MYFRFTINLREDIDYILGKVRAHSLLRRLYSIIETYFTRHCNKAVDGCRMSVETMSSSYIFVPWFSNIYLTKWVRK